MLQLSKVGTTLGNSDRSPLTTDHCSLTSDHYYLYSFILLSSTSSRATEYPKNPRTSPIR